MNVDIRILQRKLNYTNVFELILGVTVTAMVTLSPRNVRAGLYKILRKDKK